MSDGCHQRQAHGERCRVDRVHAQRRHHDQRQIRQQRQQQRREQPHPIFSVYRQRIQHSHCKVLNSWPPRQQTRHPSSRRRKQHHQRRSRQHPSRQQPIHIKDTSQHRNRPQQLREKRRKQQRQQNQREQSDQSIQQQHRRHFRPAALIFPSGVHQLGNVPAGRSRQERREQKSDQIELERVR